MRRPRGPLTRGSCGGCFAQELLVRDRNLFSSWSNSRLDQLYYFYIYFSFLVFRFDYNSVFSLLKRGRGQNCRRQEVALKGRVSLVSKISCSLFPFFFFQFVSNFLFLCPSPIPSPPLTNSPDFAWEVWWNFVSPVNAGSQIIYWRGYHVIGFNTLMNWKGTTRRSLQLQWM